MKYRCYTNKDYGMLCDWLHQSGWPQIPQESIPAYGIVLENNDGSPLGISLIYAIEDAYDFLFPALLMPNPSAKIRDLPQIMAYFSECFDEIALKHKKTHIFLTTETTAIINSFSKKHGYDIAEKSITRLVKCLVPEKKESLAFWYDQEGIDTFFPNSLYTSKRLKEND